MQMLLVRHTELDDLVSEVEDRLIACRRPVLEQWQPVSCPEFAGLDDLVTALRKSNKAVLGRHVDQTPSNDESQHLRRVVRNDVLYTCCGALEGPRIETGEFVTDLHVFSAP